MKPSYPSIPKPPHHCTNRQLRRRLAAPSLCDQQIIHTRGCTPSSSKGLLNAIKYEHLDCSQYKNCTRSDNIHTAMQVHNMQLYLRNYYISVCRDISGTSLSHDADIVLHIMQQASYCARVRMRSMYILLIPRFFEQRGIFRGRIESSTSRLFYTIDINPRNRCPAYRVCIRGVWIRIASTLCSLRDNGKLHAVRRSAKSIVHVRARSISRTRALECFYLTANLLTESANWGMQGASSRLKMEPVP